MLSLVPKNPGKTPGPFSTTKKKKKTVRRHHLESMRVIAKKSVKDKDQNDYNLEKRIIRSF